MKDKKIFFKVMLLISIAICAISFTKYQLKPTNILTGIGALFTSIVFFVLSYKKGEQRE